MKWGLIRFGQSTSSGFLLAIMPEKHLTNLKTRANSFY